MAQNPVAANLFMFVLLFAGAVGLLQTKQEVLPEFDIGIIQVLVPYPGAAPEEVEQGIVLALEEAVNGIDGVKRVTGTAAENSGSVILELLLGADSNQVLNDVKSAVDRITTFPKDAEEPTVKELSLRRGVISLIISGDQELSTLHQLAEQARKELRQDPNITQIDILGVPPRELTITVDREVLRSHSLTLNDISNQIRVSSLELPGGGIKTKGGELLVRLADRKKTAEDFGNILIRSSYDAAELRLSDIATITDGYEDNDQELFYNGKRAVALAVYRIGQETPTAVADAVKSYSEELRKTLPASIEVSYWNDQSELLKGRIQLLLDNARIGLILVFLILALFLEFRLAFWVALGIPISFLGSFILLGNTDATVNMVSLFAYIVTLGLVVDDAIVVGENVYEEHENGMDWLEASIVGSQKMVVPVTFAILTSIAAFAPLLIVPGVSGKFFKLIPIVVISVLILSLIESFFVLPAHLGHMKDQNESRFFWYLNAPQRWVSKKLQIFIDGPFEKIIRWCTVNRYISFSSAVALFFLTIGMVAGGKVPFSFFPKLDGERITVSAKLPYGAPIEQTKMVQKEIEAAAYRALERFGTKDQFLRGVLSSAGQGAESRQGVPIGSHLTTVQLSLVPSEERAISTTEVSDAWREELPDLPGVESLKLTAEVGPGAGSAAVDVQIVADDINVLKEVSDELTKRLQSYKSLANIENSLSSGKKQLDFQLNDQARTLGLTSTDVALQLRGSFFGAEALREQEGRSERKVMVRLPKDQRGTEADINEVRIRTPMGSFVPFEQLVEYSRNQSPTVISREEGVRKVNVRAELAPGVKSSQETISSLTSKDFVELQEKYPGIELSLAGEQRDQGETMASLGRNFLLALFAIYSLLAIPFRSYTQPFIIMSAIPFGFVGAIMGHVIMDYTMSVISMFGIIALTGVVVNDSLVLIDATNEYRSQGMIPFEAVIQGAKRRLRPILLTSFTTFLGLAPMILEKSTQAKFLIPMAISLGFGVLSATFIILLVVPALYMILEDILAPFPWEKTKKASTVEPVIEVKQQETVI